MNEVRQTFRKDERLCRLKLISALFEEGNSFYTPLFRVVWKISDEESVYPAQIAVSVPKKNLRAAVSRNLIKRRIREAYRKNKEALYNSLVKNDLRIILMVIYRKNEITDYFKIEKSVNELITILCKHLDKASEKC